MNERSQDYDHLLESLDKVWAEDYFIFNPIRAINASKMLL